MAESEARPRLVSVEDLAPGELPPPESSGSRWRRRGLWILGGLLALCLILLVGQFQRANRLDGELARAKSALASTRHELGQSRERTQAFERRMEAVRGHVGGLSAQLGALESLLGTAPQAPAGEAEEGL